MVNFRFCLLFSTQVLFVNILYVTSDRNTDVCEVPTYSCGLIPPVLPESFTMKATIVDRLAKRFTWREEYFDTHNLRAKLIQVIGGTELHIIFDYGSDEVISYTNYHPGSSISDDDPIADMGCTVQGMLNSDLFYVVRFRHKYGSGNQYRMYSSNEVLNYGGQHQYKFLENRTISERGLKGSVFEGCIYDVDDDKTLKSSFYWTDINDELNPSGNLAVPVKIESKGGAYVSGKFEQVDEVYDVVWFDGKDDLSDDIFQIPPRMECNFSDRKDNEKPKLSNFFSTRIEVLSMVEDWQGRIAKMSYDWQEELWYDYDQKLARLDFAHSDDLQPNEFIDAETIKNIPVGPVSAVFDFNTGVAHYTEMTFGKCVTSKIPQNLFLVTKRPLNKDVPEMATVHEIMGLDGPNMFYKGRYNVRGIGTKAWSGRQNVTSTDGKIKEIYREFYVSEGGWHEDYDDEEMFEVPIRDTHIYDSLEDKQNAKTIYEINFFKFKTSQPHISAYDISGCVTRYNRKYLRFFLEGKERDTIEKNYEVFLDSLSGAIANGADVGTQLRVQQLEVDFMNSGKFRVAFFLLDVPKETQDVSLPDKGVDLNTSVSNLEALFKTGIFEIHFRADNRQVTVQAEPNSLKELESVTEEYIPLKSDIPAKHDLSSSIPVMTSYLGQQYMSAPSSEKKPSGYSSGSLAGISIAMLIIGALIGLAAMIFYQKRKDAQSADRTQLT